MSRLALALVVGCLAGGGAVGLAWYLTDDGTSPNGSAGASAASAPVNPDEASLISDERAKLIYVAAPLADACKTLDGCRVELVRREAKDTWIIRYTNGERITCYRVNLDVPVPPADAAGSSATPPEVLVDIGRSC